MQDSSVLSQYLPATVIAAAALFFVKEVLESVRRYKSKNDKTTAISLLLADELQENYWCLQSLEELSNIFDNTPNAVYRIHIARNKTEHFRVKENPQDEYESGKAIPPFVTERYNELLPALAELNVKLFENVRAAYEKILELEHYRQTVVSFIAGDLHEHEDFDELTKGFIRHLAKEKGDYFSFMDQAYGALTNEKLKEWKLP